MDYSKDFLNNTICAEGIFDFFLNFIQGNSRISAIVGNNNNVCIYTMIPDKEKEKLEKAVSECRQNNGEVVEECIHFLKEDGQCTYLIQMNRCKESEYLDVKLLEVSRNEKLLWDISGRLKMARDFLTFCGSFMFQYNPQDNLFCLFWVNHEENVVLYEMDLDEWFGMVVENGYLEGEDRTMLEHFCRALKCEEKSDEYTFHSSIITKGETINTDNIRMAHRRYGNREMIIGLWNITDENTNAAKPHFIEEAYIDSLTGLLNKKAITDYGEKIIAEAKDRNIAIAVMDIDNFKSVNDTFGHMFGDKVIIAAADVIKNSIGENAVAGRMGGDEFMIVFCDFADETDLRNRLRCTKMNMASVYKTEMKDVAVSCSVGVSRYPRDSKCFEELLNIADKCLYIAKQKGKNRYIIFEPEKHGQFITDYSGTAMVDIKEAFYSDKDLSQINHLLGSVVVNGMGEIAALFEKVADTLLLDRVSLYWNHELQYCFANSFADDKEPLDAAILTHEEYLKLFEDDFLLYNNISRIEYNTPKAYALIKKAGIYTVIQYLLRDKEGRICGLLSAEGCQKVFSVPKITRHTLNYLGGILNSVLIREGI